MDYAHFIRFVNNSKKGDISPLLADKEAFNRAVQDMLEPFLGEKIDKVAGIEARGFIFAGAIARSLNTGVVMIRKGGKLPCEVLKEVCIDYSGEEKSLEIARDAIKKGERILVVDDWVETGAQSKAA